MLRDLICDIYEQYKTFSVFIYSYINNSGDWKNEKLCGNTIPAGRSFVYQIWSFPDKQNRLTFI